MGLVAATALNNAMNASEGSGASSNSAYSVGHGESYSDSWSKVYGSEATAKSYAEALRAHERQQDFYNQAQAYNALEAEKQRAFNYMTGNTIYSRSVEDMKRAGINPILAYNMGLSGAQVNSGATASVSTPSTFMGQTFADQASASHSESSWDTKSESSGSSWNNSESGLATALQAMGDLVGGALSKINAGNVVNIAMNELEEVADKAKSSTKKAAKKAAEKSNPTANQLQKDKYGTGNRNKIIDSLEKSIKGMYNTTGGFNFNR